MPMLTLHRQNVKPRFHDRKTNIHHSSDMGCLLPSMICFWFLYSCLMFLVLYTGKDVTYFH